MRQQLWAPSATCTARKPVAANTPQFHVNHAPVVLAGVGGGRPGGGGGGGGLGGRRRPPDARNFASWQLGITAAEPAQDEHAYSQNASAFLCLHCSAAIRKRRSHDTADQPALAHARGMPGSPPFDHQQLSPPVVNRAGSLPHPLPPPLLRLPRSLHFGHLRRRCRGRRRCRCCRSRRRPRRLLLLLLLQGASRRGGSPRRQPGIGGAWLDQGRGHRQRRAAEDLHARGGPHAHLHCRGAAVQEAVHEGVTVRTAIQRQGARPASGNRSSASRRNPQKQAGTCPPTE